MANYFVACDATTGADPCVHERSLCPPACFSAASRTEYLGDFLDAGQALVVARLRYASAACCAHCDATDASFLPAAVLRPAPALTLLRP